MARYFIGFVLSLAVALSVFLPVRRIEYKDMRELARLALPSGGRVVLLGNSVSAAISHCDDDRRSIGALLRADGVSVTELSSGGLPIVKMRDYSEIASRVPRVRLVFLPIQLNTGFFRGLAVGVDGGLLDELRTEWGQVKLGEAEPDDYKGVHYGSYADIATNYFPYERQVNTCPEPWAVNRNFLEFMYWRSYQTRPDVQAGLAEFLRWRATLASRGVELVPVLMPQNYQLIRAVNGDVFASRALGAVALIADSLRAQSVPVIDLTQKVGPAGFADAWCACGHMGQAGRQVVADALASYATQHLR